MDDLESAGFYALRLDPAFPLADIEAAPASCFAPLCFRHPRRLSSILETAIPQAAHASRHSRNGDVGHRLLVSVTACGRSSRFLPAIQA